MFSGRLAEGVIMSRSEPPAQVAPDVERLSSLARLAVVMAHEIANPLMLMKMSLRALGQGNIAPEQREAVADLHEQVERVARLVTDVLDFARPLHFTYAACDVNAVCKSAAAAVLAEEPEPRIALALDPSLPSIVTDGERLRAALINLLANARQAVTAANSETTSEGCRIELRTTSRPGGGVGIVVRDSGIGIKAADLARVFEPYFTTKRGGNGIGLPIARNVINGLDGSIRLSSEVGIGTEASIELPERPQAAKPALTAPCGARIGDLHHPCVLVVEDDPGIRTLLATGLQLEGFVVETASNGAEGLERARQVKPELVLLDLMMPVMDGEQFRAAQLRDPELAPIPVVCISAMDEAMDRDRLRATAYVTKPFDVEQIVSLIRAHCRTKCPYALCS